MDTNHALTDSTTSEGDGDIAHEVTTSLTITLVGASCVGKTAMVHRLIEGTYEQYTPATMGGAFNGLRMNIEDGRLVRIKIWDTSGHLRFRTVIGRYLQSAADAFVLVYDVTNQSSFDELEAWYNQLSAYMAEGTITVLVGHKADEGIQQRRISIEQGELVAQRHNSYFVETSSLSNIGITETFRRIAELVVEKQDSEAAQSAHKLLSREDGRDLPLASSGTSEPTRDWRDLVGRLWQHIQIGAGKSNDNDTTTAQMPLDRPLWLVTELEIRSLAGRMQQLDLVRRLFKVVVIGPSPAGKTAFIRRIWENKYLEMESATIGVDFRVRSFVMEDGEKYKLQIWDTAGLERFRTITVGYLPGASGVIIVYDISSESSFRSVKSWRQDVERHGPSGVQIVLVGLKCDKGNYRGVSQAQGEALAKEWSCPFFEASAKLDINVTDSFYCLAKMMGDARRLHEAQYGDGADA